MKNTKKKGVYNFNQMGSQNASAQTKFKQIPQTKPKKGISFSSITNEQSPKQKTSPINFLTHSKSPVSTTVQPEKVIATVSRHTIQIQDSQKGNLEIDTRDSQKFNSQQQTKTDPEASINENIDLNSFEWMFQEKPLDYLKGVSSTFFQTNKCKRIVSFLTFLEKIQLYSDLTRNDSNQEALIEHKYKEISEWIGQRLKEEQISNIVLQNKKLSQPLYHYLINNLQGYVSTLILKDQISKASIVSMLQFKRFIQFPNEQAFKYFKYQLSIIQSQDINSNKKTLWMVDLGIVTKFYRQSPFEQHGKLIYDKYKKEYTLPSQLLALKLYCQQKQLSNPSVEKDIRQLVQWALRQNNEQLPLLLYLLRCYQHKYRSCFQELTYSILKKIVCPELFLKILHFSQISIDKLKQCLNIYIEENTHYKETKKIQQKFTTDIKLKSELMDKYSLYVKPLNQWVINEKLNDNFNKRNYKAFLNDLINNFKELSTSKLILFENTLEKMIQIITSFKVACTYKHQKIKQYYKSLHELSKLMKLMVNIDKKYLSIIQGCKTYIEIKQGIFVLKEESKMISLSFLDNYLKKLKMNHQNSCQEKNNQIKLFRQSIRDSLIKLLKTKDGQLYIRFILKSEKPSQKMKSVLQEMNKTSTCFAQLQKISNSNTDNNNEQAWERIDAIIQDHPEIHKRLLLIQFYGKYS